MLPYLCGYGADISCEYSTITEDDFQIHVQGGGTTAHKRPPLRAPCPAVAAGRNFTACNGLYWFNQNVSSPGPGCTCDYDPSYPGRYVRYGSSPCPIDSGLGAG